MKKFYDGCQEMCDLCKAQSAKPKRCDRWIDHSPNGHVCLAHSDEARELTVKQMRMLMAWCFKYQPQVTLAELPANVCAEFVALLYPNYIPGSELGSQL